jgi:uncharacterized protein (DUF58 family)
MSKVAVSEIFKQIDPSIVSELKRIDFRSRRSADNQLAGSFKSSFKGSGLNFSDFREYQPGDDVRRIDWTVSARSNRIYVKDYEEERQSTFILLVDISPSTQFGSLKTSYQRIVEFSAIIGLMARKSQDRLGLLLFDSEPRLFIKPKATNRSHYLNIMYEIISAKSTAQTSNINNAIDEFLKIYKKSAIVFLLTDFHSNNFYNELGRLSIKHELICADVRSDAEYNFPLNAIINFKDAETNKTIKVDYASSYAKKALLKNFNKQSKVLQDYCRAKKADYIKIDDQPIKALRELLLIRSKKR